MPSTFEVEQSMTSYPENNCVRSRLLSVRSTGLWFIWAFTSTISRSLIIYSAFLLDGVAPSRYITCMQVNLGMRGSFKAITTAEYGERGAGALQRQMVLQVYKDCSTTPFSPEVRSVFSSPLTTQDVVVSEEQRSTRASRRPGPIRRL